MNNKLYVESQLGRMITNDGVPGQSLLTQEKRTKIHNSIREVPLADFVIDEILKTNKRVVKNADSGLLNGKSYEPYMLQYFPNIM